MIIKAAMEVGTLFKLKGQNDIFRVVENQQDSCIGCCAYGKNILCSKMPYCRKPSIKFDKLSTYEIRKIRKEKQFIEYFES